MLPAVYGCPHLLGFYAAFPTTWERIAWRVSTLVVIGSGLATLMLLEAVALVRWVISRIDRPYGRFTIPDEIVNRTIWSLTFSLYVAATGFLLAESFRQLFALPPGVFELPSWTGSFPHFG